MRNFLLSQNDINAITVALRNRVEDLKRFSVECEKQGQITCSKEFTEMAKECERVLAKFGATRKEEE